MKNSNGAVLAIVLILLLILFMVVLSLEQLIVGQRRAQSNHNDLLLAQNYARLTLKVAESTVVEFDSQLFALQDESAAIRVNKLLNNSHYDIVSHGENCNHRQGAFKVGWCYKLLPNDPVLASLPSFMPWQIKDIKITRPCLSYTALTKEPLALIDDKFSAYSKIYHTRDLSLCNDPRYMLEIVNLNYRGRYRAGHGQIRQANNALVEMVNAQQPAARVYRLTVRAFGRNGDTRVILQEYLAISSFRGQQEKYYNISQRIIPLSIRWLEEWQDVD